MLIHYDEHDNGDTHISYAEANKKHRRKRKEQAELKKLIGKTFQIKEYPYLYFFCNDTVEGLLAGTTIDISRTDSLVINTNLIHGADELQEIEKTEWNTILTKQVKVLTKLLK